MPNGGLTSQSFDLGLGNLKCSVRLRCSRCGGQGITERVQVCFREGFQLFFPSFNLPLEVLFFGSVVFLTLQSLFQCLRGLRARQSGRTAQAKRFDGLQFTLQFQILHPGPQRRLDSRQLRLPFGQGLLSVAIASQVLVQSIHGGCFRQDGGGSHTLGQSFFQTGDLGRQPSDFRLRLRDLRAGCSRPSDKVARNVGQRGEFAELASLLAQATDRRQRVVAAGNPFQLPTQFRNLVLQRFPAVL